MNLHTPIEATETTHDAYRRGIDGSPDQFLAAFSTRDAALAFARDYALAHGCDMMVRSPATVGAVDDCDF